MFVYTTILSIVLVGACLEVKSFGGVKDGVCLKGAVFRRASSSVAARRSKKWSGVSLVGVVL